MKKIKKGKSEKLNRGWKISVIAISVLNVVAIALLALAYIPAIGFSEFFIGTAYSTGSHQYYASFLYSDEHIITALQNMKIVEEETEVDLGDLVVSEEIPTSFESKSEQEVLQRKPGDVYKVVPISGSGWKGYMTVIYDPTRIGIGMAKNFKTHGQKVTEIGKRHNAMVAINSTGFRNMGGKYAGSKPTGTVVQEGKIVSKRGRSAKWGGGIVGFTKEGKLILTKKRAKQAIEELGVYNAVEFGPFLVVNGKPTKVSRGVGGINPRTFIGQRADGIVLFFVIDGRQAHSAGIAFGGMISLLKKYNVVNAANMDGGASSALAINGKLKSKPCGYTADGQRYIPVAWIVK